MASPPEVFFRAVVTNHFTEVEQLLNAGSDPNTVFNGNKNFRRCMPFCLRVNDDRSFHVLPLRIAILNCCNNCLIEKVCGNNALKIVALPLQCGTDEKAIAVGHSETKWTNLACAVQMFRNT